MHELVRQQYEGTIDLYKRETAVRIGLADDTMHLAIKAMRDELKWLRQAPAFQVSIGQPLDRNVAHRIAELEVRLERYERNDGRDAARTFVRRMVHVFADHRACSVDVLSVGSKPSSGRENELLAFVQEGCVKAGIVLAGDTIWRFMNDEIKAWREGKGHDPFKPEKIDP